MLSENIFEGDTIMVKSWWYDDHREILCKVITVHKELHPKDPYIEVRPLSGWGHIRAITIKDIV